MSDDYTHGDNVAEHDYLIYPPAIVNGNAHLVSSEVLEYDGLKFVIESPCEGAVRLTIYRGEETTPLSSEVYGN